MKRFLKFCDQLKESNKTVLKSMMKNCENNTTTRTGNNLRTIMLLTNVNHISQIKQSDLTSQTYRDIPDGEEWRVPLLKELIEARHDRNMLPEFTHDEIKYLIEIASTN